MMVCVKTVSYSIRINGDLIRPIFPQRGLRQGDPISPYLFILCTEGLSSALHHACLSNKLHGNKICRATPKFLIFYLRTIAFFSARLL